MKVNNRSGTSECPGIGTTSSFLDSNPAAGKAAEEYSRFLPVDVVQDVICGLESEVRVWSVNYPS